MFGSNLRNPLYGVFYGANSIAFTLAAVALGIGIYLVWHGQSRRAAFSLGGAVAMLGVAIDMTRVYNTEPLSVTVHPNYAIASSLNGNGDYEGLLWAHPSDLSVVVSMVTALALGWLVYRCACDKRLLTLGAAVVGCVATTAVFLSTVTYKFNAGTSAWDGFSAAEDAVWSVLLVVLVVFAMLAVTVGVVRGLRRFKRRAQIDALTGGNVVTEPGLNAKTS